MASSNALRVVARRSSWLRRCFLPPEAIVFLIGLSGRVGGLIFGIRLFRSRRAVGHTDHIVNIPSSRYVFTELLAKCSRKSIFLSSVRTVGNQFLAFNAKSIYHEKTMSYKLDKVGQAGDPVEFEVEKDRIIAYAEATNDSLPQHTSGDYAPPVFAVVSAFQSLAPIAGEIAPPEDLMRVVHGQQDFIFHKPILPGSKLSTVSTCIGVQGRSSGVTCVVKGVSHDENGELICEQYMTSFFRGSQLEGSHGEEAPDHSFDESIRGNAPLAVVDATYDKDQTFRYSPASGDPMPIHLDDDFAKAMGFPGIIIHGLCTMAMTSWAVIENTCPEDPSRLKRLAVRFNRIALPEQTISTSIWSNGSGQYGDKFHFETVNNLGDVIIKDGLAEVAPA